QLDPGVLSIGVHTVHYKATNGAGCSVTVSKSVTIDAMPTGLAITNLDPSYCVNSGIVNLVGTPAGGDFSGPGVNTINGTFDPSAPGIGTFQITYTVVNGSCVATTQQVVEVSGLPNVQINGLDTTYCKDASAIVFGGSPSGGDMKVDGT